MTAGQRALLTPLMGGQGTQEQPGYNPWPQVGQAFASTDWTKLLGTGNDTSTAQGLINWDPNTMAAFNYGPSYMG